MPPINIEDAIKLHQKDCGSVLEIEILIAKVLKVSREYLHTWPHQSLTIEQEKTLQLLVARRVQGEPIAYLVGSKEFWSLSFKVSKDVLIPRPETESLVQTVLDIIDPKLSNPKILDLGTGSGTIALALAKERPNFQITAVDNSEEALKIAKENANILSIPNITFLRSNWFSYFTSNVDVNAKGEYLFDVIVANPPYVAPDDIHLLKGNLIFEPREALVSKNNGFYDLEKIIMESPQFMESKGWLMLEHGYSQGNTVRSHLKAAGLKNIQRINDLAGLDRISIGQKS